MGLENHAQSNIFYPYYKKSRSVRQGATISIRRAVLRSTPAGPAFAHSAGCVRCRQWRGYTKRYSRRRRPPGDDLRPERPHDWALAADDHLIYLRFNRCTGLQGGRPAILVAREGLHQNDPYFRSVLTQHQRLFCHQCVETQRTAHAEISHPFLQQRFQTGCPAPDGRGYRADCRSALCPPTPPRASGDTCTP